jgi:hypothetical protein
MSIFPRTRASQQKNEKYFRWLWHFCENRQDMVGKLPKWPLFGLFLVHHAHIWHFEYGQKTFFEVPVFYLFFLFSNGESPFWAIIIWLQEVAAWMSLDI